VLSGERKPAAKPDVPAQTADLAEHWTDMLRQARRIMPNASDAKDLVQDTFERAVRALPSFRPGTNLRAWLYTIMVRRARDHFRRAKVRSATTVEPDALPAPVDEPEDTPWTRVTAEDFAAALGRLKPAFRDVFEMHEVHHLPYSDIASRLGVPINTVATRLRRAREKLRGLLIAEMARRGEAP
jgi:RNA polymerase sigma-70 factor, ECF subfamily